MTDAPNKLEVVGLKTMSPTQRKLLSVLMHAVLLSVSVLMLYPLLWMLAASFRPENEIFTSSSIWPSSISLDSYFRGWNGLRLSFGTFFVNSFTIAVLAIVGFFTAFSFLTSKYWVHYDD